MFRKSLSILAATFALLVPLAGAAPAPTSPAAVCAAADGKSTHEAPPAQPHDTKADKAKQAPLASPSAQSDPKKSPSINNFIRLKKGKDMDRLQTSIVTYRSCEDPDLEIDLVGVIHVGEKAYYEQINERLGDYDAVLYEYCGIKETIPGKNAGYPMLARALKLESQLTQIDYTRSNFIHADMMDAELREAFKKRGLKFEVPGYWMQLTMSVILRLAGVEEGRRMLAPDMAATSSRPSDAVIIGDRNQRILEVLSREMGKGHKRIAIFFGAGHMPDLDQHLVEDFSLQPVGTEWFDAWDLPNPPKKK